MMVWFRIDSRFSCIDWLTITRMDFIGLLVHNIARGPRSGLTRKRSLGSTLFRLTRYVRISIEFWLTKVIRASCQHWLTRTDWVSSMCWFTGIVRVSYGHGSYIENGLQKMHDSHFIDGVHSLPAWPISGHKHQKTDKGRYSKHRQEPNQWGGDSP